MRTLKSFHLEPFLLRVLLVLDGFPYGLVSVCSGVRYELSSGYKPAPMDLSHIKLASTQEAMVDKLAENAHNVWARDRIRQGWTYGVQQVSVRHTA